LLASCPNVETVDKPTLQVGDFSRGRPGSIPGWGTFYSTIAEIIMPKKRTTKPRKRGPKEERLIVREDPQDAINRLLKPTKPPKRSN
jgi:hypothetical protein